VTFKCKQCGWCCKNKAINISYSDIMRWKEENRINVLKEVTLIDIKDNKDTGFYFLKTIGKNRQPCPFLIDKDGFPSCSIYYSRPMACRDYPLANDDSGCPEMKRIEREIKYEKKKSRTNTKEITE